MITIDQSQDTSFTRLYSHTSEIGYLFARSSESFSQNGPGQDYIAIQQTDDQICFAVCDGVGSSFCGQLAARFLGDALVNWLVGRSEDDLQDIEQFQIKATQALMELTPEASRMVTEYEIPSRIPALVKIALEGQKQYGSETVFAAGRLDFPKDGSWHDGRLVMVWMGDTQAFLYDLQGSRFEFSDQWHNSHRWSTLLGLKGVDRVHVWSSPLEQISRVVVHSDGLKSLSDQILKLISENALDDRVSQLRELPSSDDVSLVCIDRRPRRPLLQEIDNRFRLDMFMLTWDSPEQPETYTLIESFASAAEERSQEIALNGTATSYRMRNRRPGKYVYRLRPQNGDISGEDSNEVSTQVQFSVRVLLAAAAVLIVATVVIFFIGRR